MCGKVYQTWLFKVACAPREIYQHKRHRKQSNETSMLAGSREHNPT